MFRSSERHPFAHYGEEGFRSAERVPLPSAAKEPKCRLGLPPQDPACELLQYCANLLGAGRGILHCAHLAVARAMNNEPLRIHNSAPLRLLFGYIPVCSRRGAS